MTTTHAEAVSRLYAHLEAGTLTRRSNGYRTEGGRRRADLLPAMVPEYNEHGSIFDCPPEVMPRWLANLTPWLSDNGSQSKWLALVRRYARIAAGWDVLTDDEWVRLDYKCRAIVVREAMREVDLEPAHDLCDRVAACMERGEAPAEELWAAVREAPDVAQARSAEFETAIAKLDYRDWRRVNHKPKARKEWREWFERARALRTSAWCVALVGDLEWSARLGAEAAIRPAAVLETPEEFDEEEEDEEEEGDAYDADGEAVADRITAGVLDLIEAAIEHANAAKAKQ